MRRRQKPLRVNTDGHVRYALDGDELEVKISSVCALGGHPANADVYAPKSHQRVPKTGAWAMITRQLPPMEFGLDEHVLVGRVFYVQHHGNADDEGFTTDGTYKVTCVTPWHELTLWPYEYTVVPPARLINYWQQGALLFHATNVEPGRLNEVVFYARSRGIDVADAIVMALGTLEGPVGWFEPHESLADDLEAMAVHINQWPWDDTKRKAAQARKHTALK